MGLGYQSLDAQINADFSTSNREACGSLQTNFFDQSTSDFSIISWEWDLGGNTSSKQNPGAIFTEPGQYTICLTVTDVNGNSDTECKEDYIHILSNPVASFMSDITQGCAPITVNFEDLSTSENGPITSWLWDIGGSTGVVNTEDGELAITSTYNTGGNYTASLTVMDSLGCSHTQTLNNFVNVFQIPQPDIGFNLISSCQLPWEVQFYNNNLDDEVSYFWNFGNGTTFSGSTPPIIEYTEIRLYDITIYMESGDCLDTLFLENYIDTDVTASFSYSPLIACEKSQIQFTDESIVEAEGVFWNFGDGNSSNSSNPRHTYDEPGCYDVTLIRSAGECSDTAMISCIEILPLPEVEFNIENRFDCTLPTSIVLTGNSQESGMYSWLFYDASQSIASDSNNTEILIEEFGIYHVDVNFTNDLGCSISQDSLLIDIQPFEVNLPTEGPSGCAPLTFSLEDSITSSVDVINWQWSIGNGSILSDLSNPTFTIQDSGRFDVQLIAENIYGCIDTVLIEDYIKVGIPPVVDFTGFPLEGCVDVEQQFIDLSSDYADEWEWFIHESSWAIEQNPLITQSSPGTFDVTLHASHNGCKDSLTIEDFLTIFAPSSRFDIIYNCEDPYTVEIENKSFGADSLLWTLRLSETDSLFFTDSIFGTYTFPDRGSYTLTHYSKSFETGCDLEYTDTIKVVDPIASYVTDTLRGCAPLEIQLGNYSQDAISYEYISDIGSIDSIFNAEPIITFTEGGVINGPLLIVTDIHECRDSFQLMDSVVINKLEADVSFPEVICISDFALLEDQSFAQFSNKIAWSWNVGNGKYLSNSQDTTIFIDSVGMYNVYFTVEDDWGCKDSIFLPQAINAIEVIPDFTSDTLGCTWSPISFESQGDNGFISDYFWDFGDGNTSVQKNPDHIYNEEGVYNVCLTLYDGRGCGKTICKEEVITIIDPKAGFIGDPIFATCPPLLTNFFNTSEDAVSYVWDFGDNSGLSENESPSHVYTSPGRFDVMLIAQSTSKCMDTLILEEYVRVEGPSGEFTFDISSQCLPISIELIAGSDGYYSYTWDYGNGELDSIPGLVIADTTSYTYTETGIFTPKLIITDSIGCSRSFAGDPIVVNDIELEFDKDSIPLCGPPLDVFLENLSSGTTDNVAYTWFLDGPQNFTSDEKDPVFNIVETGLYSVNLVANYENCVDTLSKPDFLEVSDIPEVSFEILTDQLCEDVNVEFLNTTTLGYGQVSEWIWDFGDGNISNEEHPFHNYTGLDSRVVSLKAVTNFGCTDSFSLSFDVLPSMPIQAGEDKLICIGDEVQLDGYVENLLEGGTFYWEADNTLSCQDCLDPIANPTFSKRYVLVSVHPSGCEFRDTVDVTVIPIPGPELSLSGDSLICLGDSALISVDNFNPGYEYNWNQDAEGLDCYGNCDKIYANPEEATMYYVTVVNEFGCFEMDSVFVDVETDFVDFLPTVKGICAGESTTLSISAGNNPIWEPDEDISCLTCEEIEISPTTSKRYFISVESDLGCKYYDSIEVVVIPANLLSAGPDQEICFGESIELNAAGVGNPNWYPTHIIDDPTAFNTSAQPDSSGYISLHMIFDECTQTDSFYVEVHISADISAVGDSICLGQSGILHAMGRADRIQWIMDDGTDLISDSIVVSSESTRYYDAIGYYKTCLPDTSKAMLFVYPEINYSLPNDVYTIHLNDEIKIEPDFDEDRNYTFEWIPDDGLDCGDCADPVIKGLMDNMDYTLWIRDEDSGCESDFQIEVRFQNECTQSIFHLPNIFSPNGDGLNDEFFLSTKNPEEFVSMTIFDRWGNLLFSSEDISKGWDGRKNGHAVTMGVYVYKLELICPFTNENYVILGDVTVIR